MTLPVKFVFLMRPNIFSRTYIYFENNLSLARIKLFYADNILISSWQNEGLSIDIKMH
jgi:hypothetical protein